MIERLGLLEKAKVLLADGKLDDADRMFRAILAEDPNDARAIKGMGDVAQRKGNSAWAAEFFQIALQIDPALVSARIALGEALRLLGRPAEALVQLRAAVAQRPDAAPAHYWIGHILLEAGDYDGALAAMDHALAADRTLVAPVSLSVYDLFEQCDWTGWYDLAGFLERSALEGRAIVSPMTLMMATGSAQAIANSTRTYAATHYPAKPPMREAAWPSHDKIRVGYLSSDFHDHPVAHVIAGLLEAHDHSAFEVTAFSCGPERDSPIRQRLVAAVDHFRVFEVGADEEVIARAVCDAQIDILVALGGYTANARPEVLAWRPAPVQVNMLGFPGGLGAPYVDYIIADRTVIPETELDVHTERVVWLPHVYQPTDDKAPIDHRMSTRLEAGLPENAFVLMAYNRTHKISPIIFAVWMNLLRRLEGAVLWMQGASEAAQANLRREAFAAGLDPDRLIFAPRADTRAAHMARTRLADLFIDTLPYNAHSTASDALWAGVPVVTCRGTAFPGRVCAALLHAAGQPELIAENLNDYEDLIVALAGDPARLADLRRRLAGEGRQSPLFDTARYARDLEAAFRTMHARNLAAQPPISFAVDASD